MVSVDHQSYPPVINKTQGPQNALGDALAEFSLTVSEPNISTGKRSLKKESINPAQLSFTLA